ncbi:MAG: hypothetical protein GY791_04095 [Alphaproteobacteria bacterium]|nr:hypothetical protein [Alphaproteobacteria bacterium]
MRRIATLMIAMAALGATALAGAGPANADSERDGFRQDFRSNAPFGGQTRQWPNNGVTVQRGQIPDHRLNWTHPNGAPFQHATPNGRFLNPWNGQPYGFVRRGQEFGFNNRNGQFGYNNRRGQFGSNNRNGQYGFNNRHGQFGFEGGKNKSGFKNKKARKHAFKKKQWRKNQAFGFNPWSNQGFRWSNRNRRFD